jgi:hypothetical protein
MIGGYPMACSGCGKRKSPSFTTSSSYVATITDPTAMPTTLNGNVLVQYIGGKGRGKHYYEGRVTKIHYKVQYGMYLYADTKDTRLASEITNSSLLVRYEPPQVTPIPQVVKSQTVEASVVKVDNVVPAPVMAEKVDRTKVLKDLPDITNMTVANVMQSDDITVDNAKKLLKIEKEGLNRMKVVDYLTRLLGDA